MGQNANKRGFNIHKYTVIDPEILVNTPTTLSHNNCRILDCTDCTHQYCSLHHTLQLYVRTSQCHTMGVPQWYGRWRCCSTLGTALQAGDITRRALRSSFVRAFDCAAQRRVHSARKTEEMPLRSAPPSQLDTHRHPIMHQASCQAT